MEDIFFHLLTVQTNMKNIKRLFYLNGIVEARDIMHLDEETVDRIENFTRRKCSQMRTDERRAYLESPFIERPDKFKFAPSDRLKIVRISESLKSLALSPTYTHDTLLMYFRAECNRLPNTQIIPQCLQWMEAENDRMRTISGFRSVIDLNPSHVNKISVKSEKCNDVPSDILRQNEGGPSTSSTCSTVPIDIFEDSSTDTTQRMQQGSNNKNCQRRSSSARENEEIVAESTTLPAKKTNLQSTASVGRTLQEVNQSPKTLPNTIARKTGARLTGIDFLLASSQNNSKTKKHPVGPKTTNERKRQISSSGSSDLKKDKCSSSGNSKISSSTEQPSTQITIAPHQSSSLSTLQSLDSKICDDICALAKWRFQKCRLVYVRDFIVTYYGPSRKGDYFFICRLCPADNVNGRRVSFTVLENDAIDFTGIGNHLERHFPRKLTDQ